MKRTLVRLGLAALVSSALFGCGSGGSDGINGTSPPATTVTVPVNVANKMTISSNATSPSSESVSAWKTMQPQITVSSVTIASPPVVKFTVKDSAGNAIVGLGNKAQSATATVANYVNMSFTLAKLVPGANGDPSKWVSYNVIKPPTVAQKGGTVLATDSCNADKTWCGTYPAADSQGTLKDNGDGTYEYTFFRDPKLVASIAAGLVDSVDGLSKKADLGDLSFNPTLTHRLGIQLGGAAPGTGSNTPNGVTAIPGVNMVNTANVVFDFRPDGAAVTTTRDVSDIESCAACHNGKVLAHGSRKDPRYCVTCHTDQVKYSFSQEASSTNNGMTLTGTTTKTTAVVDGRALGDFTNLMHKIHMGEELVKQGYNYHNALKYNAMKLPQDPRNCTKCHSGSAQTDVNQAVKTKDGDNWKTVPSRLACASCHDGINFTTGLGTTNTGATTGHGAGGAQIDDSKCATCHTAAAIPVYHRTNVPTANNPIVAEGVSTISYEIKSGGVVINANRNLEITFRIVKDGSPVTSFAVPTTTTSATTGVVSVPSTFQPIANFTGGPSFYVAYAVPQDGITSPVDYNTYQSVSLANLLVASGSPKAGTLTGPDSSGYWKATLTGDTVGMPVSATCKQNTGSSAITGNCVNPSPIVIPTTAKMVTAMIGGAFSQRNLATYTTGLTIKTTVAKLVATGSTARRVIVDNNRCESCHEQLGTIPDFHSGARNDATMCAVCHNPSRTSSGWSANASTFVHGLHAASKRTVPFNWHRTVDWDGTKIVYPGILKRCENCHVANAVNYGATGATIQPNLLWSTTGVGKYNSATDTYKALSPYITADNVKNYGNNFTFAPQGAVVATITKADGSTVAGHVAGTGGEIVEADAASLVETPITSACFACHDAPTAKAHMTQYGGVIYGTRSASTVGGKLVSNETCLVCHGMGRDQDAAVVHAK